MLEITSILRKVSLLPEDKVRKPGLVGGSTEGAPPFMADEFLMLFRKNGELGELEEEDLTWIARFIRGYEALRSLVGGQQIERPR